MEIRRLEIFWVRLKLLAKREKERETEKMDRVIEVCLGEDHLVDWLTQATSSNGNVVRLTGVGFLFILSMARRTLEWNQSYRSTPSRRPMRFPVRKRLVSIAQKLPSWTRAIG